MSRKENIAFGTVQEVLPESNKAKVLLDTGGMFFCQYTPSDVDISAGDYVLIGMRRDCTEFCVLEKVTVENPEVAGVVEVGTLVSSWINVSTGLSDACGSDFTVASWSLRNSACSLSIYNQNVSDAAGILELISLDRIELEDGSGYILLENGQYLEME